jgi:hypothetical protein
VSAPNATVAPLWYYVWAAGVSMKLGAVVRDGATLTGPVPVDDRTRARLGFTRIGGAQ